MESSHWPRVPKVGNRVSVVYARGFLLLGCGNQATEMGRGVGSAGTGTSIGHLWCGHLPLTVTRGVDIVTDIYH
ncbi:hypothetical protein ACOMHN_067411 [Nucella lapillus]